jgi:arginase
MALALLTGRCWPKLLAQLEAFEPVPPIRVIQVGVRDSDPEEEEMLARSGIVRVGVRDLPHLNDAIEQLGRSKLYVHLDVDVLDRSEGWANSYASDGGLTLEQLRDALILINRTRRVVAISVTAYDPAADYDRRIARAIPKIVALLAPG